MSRYFAYIGSWVSPRYPDAVRGITIAEYDSETGAFTALKRVEESLNCSMLTYDEKRGVLYTSNECQQTAAGPGGRAAAFRVDRKTGDLEKISDVSSYGKMPSYVAVDPLGEFLVLTNHSMNSTILKTVQDENGEYHLVREYDETAGVLYALNPDGSIGEVCDIFKHTGHGGKPEQTNPHMHSARFTPDGKYVFVCDKGNDGYYSYYLDRENRKMVLNDRLESVPGAAPRYSALHKDLPVLYCNNEAERIVTAISVDENGKLTKIADYSSVLPSAIDEGLSDSSKSGMQSELLLSDDCKTLYNVVRRDNLISVFSVDETSGELTLIQNAGIDASEGGRAAAFSPDGKCFYLCGGPDSDILGYKVEADGTLTSIESVFRDVAPGALVFVKAE